jgi:hypothetical protein
MIPVDFLHVRNDTNFVLSFGALNKRHAYAIFSNVILKVF